MSMNESKIPVIQPAAIVGFNGRVCGGVAARGGRVVYPLGCLVVLHEAWPSTGSQRLLRDRHAGLVSALTLSLCGDLLATGHHPASPFHKARVCLWDLRTCTLLGHHEAHVSHVQRVAFSSGTRYLLSVSGPEECSLAVWDTTTRSLIACKRLAKSSSSGAVISGTWCHERVLLTGGEEGLTVWQIEPASGRLTATPANLGKLKRTVLCIMVDEEDEFLYCGTSSGDVVKVRLNLDPVNSPRPVLLACMAKPAPRRAPAAGSYANGVRALVRLDTRHLVVGAGDGVLEVVEERSGAGGKMGGPVVPALHAVRRCKLRSAISSVARLHERLIVGTEGAEIFSVNALDLNHIELHVTCHPSAVRGLALPRNTGLGVFVTGGEGAVRVWRTSKEMSTITEVRRLCVPGLTAHCVQVTRDGTNIFSAWNDGTIRAHGPESGRLLLEIPGAHRAGVSALAITANGSRIISGGGEGHVRVWDLKGCRWTLTKVFAEQRGRISQVTLREDDQEVAAVCEDGTCYVWALQEDDTITCRQALRAPCSLSAVSYVPETPTLLLTAGSDGKLRCWDTARGALVREMKLRAPITALHVPRAGKYFATGFQDGGVTVWSLVKGEALVTGQGHGAVITCVALTEDSRVLLSASQDGAILSWDCSQLAEAKKVD